MPSGTYTYTLYTITGSGNSNFTVTGSFTVTVFDSDDNLGVGDDNPGTETGAAPVIQALGAGAPAGWNVGDTFYFGGSRGIEVGSPTDDFFIPRVNGSWQTSTALYSLPGASVPLVVGQSYTRAGAAGNVDEETAPCFVAGSFVKTSLGEISVEELAKGDKVFTLDSGFMPVEWVGAKTVKVTQKTAPIRFEIGTMGNDRPLLVSPNHRMLVRCPEANVLFGESEVLVPAKHLVGMHGVKRAWPNQVTYVHVLFNSHEIICANGAMSESFHPGLDVINSLGAATRQEVLDLFPDLSNGPSSQFDLARTCLRSYEASVLLETLH